MLNEIAKPMHQYLPQDVRTLDPMGRITFPDFDWFPSLWSTD
jgi:hypothetical protein